MPLDTARSNPKFFDPWCNSCSSPGTRYQYSLWLGGLLAAEKPNQSKDGAVGNTHVFPQQSTTKSFEIKSAWISHLSRHTMNTYGLLRKDRLVA